MIGKILMAFVTAAALLAGSVSHAAAAKSPAVFNEVYAHQYGGSDGSCIPRHTSPDSPPGFFAPGAPQAPLMPSVPSLVESQALSAVTGLAGVMMAVIAGVAGGISGYTTYKKQAATDAKAKADASKTQKASS
jgi:hypothetical protein